MYNKAILIGRLVADPELRQTPNGISVCTFRVAVDRAYQAKGGEKQADFIDVVAWRQQAEFVSRFFSKGKLILVEGSIQTRTYTDKNDQKRYAVEVVAENVRFVGSKAESGGDSRPAQGNFGTPPPTRNTESALAAPPAYSSGSADDFAEIEDDGDLPF